MQLADKTGVAPVALPESIGGQTVNLVDPSGNPVRVVAGLRELPALPGQDPHVFNFGSELNRINATQRPPRSPARIERLGHVVLSSTKYIETLNWYLEHFGLIVSDFLYYSGQRDRGRARPFAGRQPRQAAAGGQ